MSYEKYDHGPLQTYEVIWKSGHIETVQGHQVSYTGGATMAILGGPEKPCRFRIHGDFDGHWRLMLSGLEDDTVAIRNVTEPERAS